MVNKACSAHIEYRESCFKCKKTTALAAQNGAVKFAHAPPYANGYPIAQENVPGQFTINCRCGLTTTTRYLTGTCECGRVWNIEWAEAKREYERITNTHVLSISEQEHLK